MPAATLTRPEHEGKVHPGLERKSVAVETKVIDPIQGIAQIIVSTTNVVDDGMDVIVPGAYAETLRKRNPKGVAHHDITKPVARTVEAEEILPGDPSLPAKVSELGGGALRILAQFNLKTQRGREAFEDVVFYEDEQEYSIGYAVPPGGASYDDKTGVRTINRLELFEWSPVIFGMAPGTGTSFAKAAYGDDSEDVTMVGSYEALTRHVLSAVEGVLGNGDTGTLAGQTVSVVGTFPDKVFVCVETDDLKETYFEVSYTVTDKGEVSLGPINEVSLETVAVVKDSGVETEVKGTTVETETEVTETKGDEEATATPEASETDAGGESSEEAQPGTEKIETEQASQTTETEVPVAAAEAGAETEETSEEVVASDEEGEESSEEEAVEEPEEETSEETSNEGEDEEETEKVVPVNAVELLEAIAEDERFLADRA